MSRDVNDYSRETEKGLSGRGWLWDTLIAGCRIIDFCK